MRRNIRNLVAGVLLALILTSLALAEKQSAVIAPQSTTSEGFRIDVDTNKDVYYDRDVFILTVKLLNNSSFSLLITDEKLLPDESEGDLTDENLLPDESEGDLVDSALFEGYLDGSDVDVAFIAPRHQVIIGYATLTPLDSISHPHKDDPQLSNQTSISLPLFEHSKIPAHSTTIISTANVLIAIPREQLPKSETGGEDNFLIIPVVDQYVHPTPGSYLLNCTITININGSAKVAKAQKIIWIGSRL